MISKGGSKVEGFFRASLRLTVSVGVEKEWYSWKITDAYVGLDLHGKIDFTVELRVSAGLRLVTW